MDFGKGPDRLGYSPDQLEDQVTRLGGLDPATTAVQSARAGEQFADPELMNMSPNDRAALDRYTNFAKLAEMSDNPLLSGINYVGGMGAMGLTELLKLFGGDEAASAAWNKGKKGTKFFGGKDQSRPALSNLTSAHYGFMRGRKKKAPKKEK